MSQGGPIKPKVVTSTKDLHKGKSKKIDAEKIVLDGGEVRGKRSKRVKAVCFLVGRVSSWSGVRLGTLKKDRLGCLSEPLCVRVAK